MPNGSNPMGAEEFLEALDTDSNLRQEALTNNPIVAWAQQHGFEFTAGELNAALVQKWGKPIKREGVASPLAFTCCFSEPPGV